MSGRGRVTAARTHTYTYVVLPRMISRFSNADRDVRFLGHDWMSKNPVGHPELRSKVIRFVAQNQPIIDHLTF